MDVLELVAKIKLDSSGYEDGLSKIINGVSKITSAGGKAMSALTKVSAAAVGAATTGVGILVKKSVEAYGDYEQLVGGVQKLYGNMGMSLETYAQSVGKTTDQVADEYGKLEEAQNLVIKNAENAFKTSGMSMNQYMETATSFSAALINSLGGDTLEAAKQTDVAMRAISDNFNTFGGDISMIQGAFQGFAKQNYTMLDNLKLGYGGTKEEMQKLIDDANTYAEQIGRAADLSIDSFSDIVTAIDLIQKKQKIAGTTAREATTTIQGSLGMVKAAWENLMTGLGDSKADVGKLVNDLVQTLTGSVGMYGKHINGLFDNLLPVVENALSGIGTLVEKLVPKAMDLIPGIINDVVPKLISAGTNLMTSFGRTITDNIGSVVEGVNALAPEIINAILAVTPQIITIIGEVVSAMASAISENADQVVQGVLTIVKVFSSTFGDLLPIILEVGMQVVTSLAKGIASHASEIAPAIAEVISQLVNIFTQNASSIVSLAGQIIKGLADGLMQAMPVLIPTCFELMDFLISTLMESLPEILQFGLDLILQISQGILEALPQLLEYLPLIITTISDFLVENLPAIIEAATTLFLGLVDALPDILIALVDGIQALIDAVVNIMTGGGKSDILRAAGIMFLEIVAALPKIAGALLGALFELLGSLISAIGTYHLKMMTAAIDLFQNLASGIAKAAGNIINEVKSLVSKIVNAVKDKISEFREAGGNMVDGLWNGLKGKWDSMVTKLKALAANLPDAVKKVLKIESPSKVFKEIGGYMAEGLGLGWEDEIDDVNKRIGKDLNYKGSIDVATNVDDSMLSKSVQAKPLTDMDIERILGALSINLYNTTSVDGEVINQKSYKYTVERIGTETRAVRTAMGGAYV